MRRKQNAVSASSFAYVYAWKKKKMSSPHLWCIKWAQSNSSQDKLRRNGGLTSERRWIEVSVLLSPLSQHGATVKKSHPLEVEQAGISEAPDEGVYYSHLWDINLSEPSTVIRMTPVITVTLITALCLICKTFIVEDCALLQGLLLHFCTLYSQSRLTQT